MASLSIKFLTGLGIDEDKADLICERHKEVLTEIKEERDKYREEAEKLPEIQKQLDVYKEAEKNSEKDPYKVKYEAIKEEYAEYKKGIEAKETTAKKEEAYKQLLKNAGISEKRIASILKVSDIDGIELDEQGKPKNSEKLTESIKAEWADFIQTSQTEGAKIANPPSNNLSVKSKKDIMAIKNTTERQNAWAEYITQNSQKGN